MMLVDKGYFDYDYEKVDAPPVYVERTEDEMRDWLAGFGIGTAVPKKPETTEEIQEHIIKQMEDK